MAHMQQMYVNMWKSLHSCYIVPKSTAQQCWSHTRMAVASVVDRDPGKKQNLFAFLNEYDQKHFEKSIIYMERSTGA